MPLDIEGIRRRNAELKRARSGTGFKCQQGENVIRILSFTHKVTKEDVSEGRFPKDKLGKTVEEFDREVVRQFGFTENNSPIFSTDKSLAEYDKVKKSKDPEDMKIAKSIRPDRKYAMNIVDMNDPEKGVQLYLAPKTVREIVGDHIEDPDYGVEIIGLAGRDFKIHFDKNAEAAQMYKVIISPKPGKKFGSKVQELVKDLWDPEVYNLFAKVSDDEDLEAKTPVEKEEMPKGNGKKSSIFDD